LSDDADCGVARVGRPKEVTRVLDPGYLDEARRSFREYVRRTLAASQAAGGRFNPPGEFGALYTAGDEATAWEEVAARFRRQGVTGLPPAMGLLRIAITGGRFADLTDPAARDCWDVSERALTAAEPSPDERERCWALARGVRAVADFLVAPAARAAGENVPLYPDREHGALRMTLRRAARRAPPAHLAQAAREAW
jgi:RES domain-containing protein